ncbi:hypothetical protein MBAV_000113 [Candidatus Magnetobacterium bavaricum]|uniref:Uncharacterized protein n=1 Tax=Candidatus Magnetobacterium bavaricum TaxID=29290 RepID=A0A0F3H406_9BACT|nr:hypothetical protein MBAV_000113 [Candidatus Magnetobacterium bavaricum]
METNTIEETVEQVQQIHNDKVDAIKEALKELSPPLIDSLNEYVSFLIEKERKHKVFVERILEIEANSDTVIFDSVEEAMEAIRNRYDFIR